MIVKQISYGRTFNDGDFTSTRIDFVAELQKGDDAEEAFQELVDFVNDSRVVEKKQHRK